MHNALKRTESTKITFKIISIDTLQGKFSWNPQGNITYVDHENAFSDFLFLMKNLRS